jgi:hypothetical protein
MATRIAVAQRIVADEIVYLGRRYGDGRQRGSEPLPYHNAVHTKGGVEAVTQIGARLVETEQVRPWYVYLLRIGEAYHDHEQGLDPDDNVMASADAAASAMSTYPLIFPAHEIAEVRAGIASTRTRIVNGMVVQVVDFNDLFCKALADGDLAHLGMQTGIQSSFNLNEELQRRAGQKGLDRNITIEFLNFSAELFRTHEFHLPESRELFPGQQENHRQLVDLTEKYVRRELTYKQLRQFAAMAARSSTLV